MGNGGNVVCLCPDEKLDLDVDARYQVRQVGVVKWKALSGSGGSYLGA